MSRPASSSGVSGWTEAIVGTFVRCMELGMISNSEAMMTASRRPDREQHRQASPACPRAGSRPRPAFADVVAARGAAAPWTTGSSSLRGAGLPGLQQVPAESNSGPTAR